MKRIYSIIFGSLLFASSAHAVDYTLDADHTTVGFKIKHLAVSTVSGRFTQFSGTFSFDPKNIKASRAEANIVASSINTEQQKRDDHLRSPDFFDVEKYQSISFHTTKIEPESSNRFKAHGELSIHGVSKPVVLDVTYEGAATDPWGNERVAFTATTKINRKDFGLTWNKVLETGGFVVGDDVAITIEAEGIKKK